MHGSCQRAEKSEESEGDADNNSWLYEERLPCHQASELISDELEIRGRFQTIEISVLLKFVLMSCRPLNTCSHSDFSVKSPRKTGVKNT